MVEREISGDAGEFCNARRPRRTEHRAPTPHEETKLMKVLARLGFAAGVAVAVTASFAGSAYASPGHSHATGVVFVQTDNTTGNQVVVYDRAPDGSLTIADTYATGGDGGVLAGSAVDHLASQGSLVYDAGHGLLYAVNAGSDTVSVFSVHGD